MEPNLSKPIIMLTLLGIFSMSMPAYGIQAQRDSKRYSKCVDLTSKAPDKAINEALVWQNERGGVPARHCEALGLFHLQEYSEAAARLEKIAEDMRVGRDMPLRGGSRTVATEAMLADMFGQAANAWLLAGKLLEAEAAIDTALSLSSPVEAQHLDLLVDRARIAAADRDFELALTDLEKVLKQDPGRKNILVLVAAAARNMEDFVKAEIALREYQTLFPEHVDGHLERGNLSDAEGETEQARASWRKVLELTEQGPSAEAARLNLERINLQKK